MLGAAGAMAAAVPSLQLGECSTDDLAGGSAAARCGWMTVAENPEAATSRPIRLRITVIPSLRLKPEADAFTILAGGPGQGAHDFYVNMAWAFAGMRRDRDILLVDQRGTGRIEPPGL